MSEATHCDRRRFIGSAVTAIAGAGLLVSRLGDREPWSRAGGTPSANGSLGVISQTDAGGLQLRHAEAGPPDGPAAVLLHGEGGNMNTDAASLAARGYRVIVPHGEQGATPSDVLALMATLKIEKALVSGRAESARTAEVRAALWLQRVKRMGPVSGLGVVALAATQRPLPPTEELAWWYEYYLTRRQGDA